jgi:DNA helicase HerA-like ATPase
MKNQILIGANQVRQQILMEPSMSNRHGLIAGATGTGKTVTLQVLAEAFSSLGISVFAADVKGDLAGLAKAGAINPRVQERLDFVGVKDHNFRANPVVIWDVQQKHGIPIRASISEVGPMLLAHMLDVNETQAGVLHIAFRVADDQGLLLLDLKDLQALLTWLVDNKEAIQKTYGNIAPQTVGALQRKLLVLEDSGANLFFGEPALEIKHLLQKDASGKGIINLLDARALQSNPRIYASFLLWLLSELFENLPEVGDLDLPKLVFFFDEAHLLFSMSEKILLEKIEQVVRLIRSKGVGIFFITQHPQDIPDSVLSQLGNRFQHALRAFTPNEQKAVQIAARSFRVNEKFKTEDLICTMGVGEALVSVLNKDGVPTVVEHVKMIAPMSQIGALTADEHLAVYKDHILASLYSKTLDRESAYEVLKKQTKDGVVEQVDLKLDKKKPSSNRQGAGEAFIKSLLRSIGSNLGREIFRGLLGGLKR